MNTYSNDSKPLVSVLMTAYNREDYIAEAIDSVLASTYTNFELIIVDDISKDKTVDIAREYERKDPRVKVYVNEKNLGDYPNRNKAASYAKGKYLKYLDSDDKIFEFGLEYCVDQMEKHPEADLGMVVYYDDLGSEDRLCWTPEKIVHDHFFDRQYLNIGPSGTIIRTKRFRAVNGFNTNFGVASDSYFNIKIAASSPIVLLPKPFFYYRVHAGQEHKNTKGYVKYGYLYFKELLENVKLPLSKKEIAFLHKKMEKRHAITLTQYAFSTRDWTGTRRLLKETNFKFTDILSGYFK
jgi:glycosyltransferase involved in cell wall biosynthesis